MRVPVSWLREFTEVPAEADGLGARLATCGFEVAAVEGEVVDFEVTANRPDCLSIYGFAREAATAFGTTLAPFDVRRPAGAGPADPLPPPVPDAGDRLPVSLDDAACGRYALGLADVQIGPSPAWLAARLQAAGVRPINNIVDVTNYVMLELGHPLHAFDVARLAGPEIRVRLARAGERMTTLDGQSRALDDTMLVIADRDAPVAIAGVMGGLGSEVSSATRRIAIESAWFLPASVRVTSRRLGLKTEASARFERGADAGAPAFALARALALLAQIGAGRSVGPIVDVYPNPRERRTVALRRDRLRALLGDTVPDADVARILAGLGFGIADARDGWTVTVPSFRVDVTREADLVEEVGRHWGFDRIPATFPALTEVPRPSPPGVDRGRRIRRLLGGAGLQEAATLSFIDPAAAEPFVADDARVSIRNPLSDKFVVLRPSLLPGLLDSLVHSRRRESANVRLFEVGTVFLASGELPRVGWVVTGSRGAHWLGDDGPVTFHDAKGVAELLASALAVPIAARVDDDLTWFAPGRRARLVAGTTSVGWVGQLRPDLVADRGLDPSEIVFGGELDVAALAGMAPASQRAVEPLPRFPSVVRDLAILVDERLPAAELRGTIQAHAPATLVSVQEFDRYQGRGVPAGQVSLALRLTFRHADRTLTDDEVQQSVDDIVAALTRTHQAVLRGAAGHQHGE